MYFYSGNDYITDFNLGGNWPSAAGPFVASQDGQKTHLAEVRLCESRARQSASREKWQSFVKKAAEESPNKLYKWVRGSTKVWDLEVQTESGWAASPGA
eukprot:237061-Amphidinium_carterae.1